MRVNKFDIMISNYIETLKKIDHEIIRNLNEIEIKDLLESFIRLDKEKFILKLKVKNKQDILLNEEYVNLVLKNILDNLIILDFCDQDVLELLLFSIEFAFSMLEGKTKATKTQKAFRERERELETIIVNTFIGLLGEVALKKFIESRFGIAIKLDRSISDDISRYKTDILNANSPISIKTTPNLKAIWAECPKEYHVGVFVKTSVPKGIFISAMAHVCGFKKLIDFTKNKLSNNELITNLENRIYFRQCGVLNEKLKCIICGYFETFDVKLTTKGTKLPFLGEVREERYLVKISELRSSYDDWNEFIEKYIII